MLTSDFSLLGGRRKAPLSAGEARRAASVFLGLDPKVPARFEENATTVFRVAVDDHGEEYGEIVFGPDIYPGESIVDPNSAMSLRAAAAHELAHYHRWHDQIALAGAGSEHLDEALTSLQAIARYERHLDESDVRHLVADAMLRIQLHLRT